MSTSLQQFLSRWAATADPEIKAQAYANLNFSEEECAQLEQYASTLFQAVDRFITEVWALEREKELLGKWQNKMPGFVYFIRLFDNVYKVGKSKNPDNRFNTIRVYARSYLSFMGRPESVKDICLVHTVSTQDMTWLENYVHCQLQDFKTSLDWHNVSKDWAVEQALSKNELFAISDEVLAHWLQIQEKNPEWYDAAEKLYGQVA